MVRAHAGARFSVIGLAREPGFTVLMARAVLARLSVAGKRPGTAVDTGYALAASARLGLAWNTHATGAIAHRHGSVAAIIQGTADAWSALFRGQTHVAFPNRGVVHLIRITQRVAGDRRLAALEVPPKIEVGSTVLE